MLDTVIQIPASTCRFEILEGEWPKPVELPWMTTEPTLTKMFFASSYRAEGRYAETRGRSYSTIGRTFMLLPEHELIGRGSGGKIRAARCVFNLDIYRSLVSPDFALTEAELQRCFDVGNSTVSLLMQRLMQEAAQPGFASQMLIDSIATTLLIECGRQIYGEALLERGDIRASLQPRHLSQIEDYLDGVEVGMPRISDLANLCGFSTHYFSKLFRRATGQSLGRYLADWRLRRAERLLIETDLPLKEIAYRLGFSNAANFSTAFSNELNQTPGMFRKMRDGSSAIRIRSAPLRRNH